MRSMSFLGAAAVLLAAAGSPALAQESPSLVPVADMAIVRGDFAQAETELQAQLRRHPDMPELLLNLAAVYGATGRTTEARNAYQRVLAQRDVDMDLRNGGQGGAHAIAELGLRRLARAQLSAR
jgi:Tfp pilus assembly protein PilF